MKLKSIIIFFFLTSFSFGQTKEIDSLKSLLNFNENSEHQFNLNLDISKLIENKNRDSSKIFANNAEKIAIELNNNSLLDKSLLQQGILHYKEKKDDIALNYFNKIDSLFSIDKRITESYIMTKLYRAEISKFSFTLPGVLKAKKYLLEGKKLAEQAKDENLDYLFLFRLGEWHGFIAQAESPEQHLDSAKTYINDALKYYTKQNDYEYMSRCYYTMASIESSRNNLKEAEKYYLKRLEIIKKTNDSIKIGEAFYGLGSICRKFKLPEKGLKYLDSAASIFKKHGFSTDDRKKNLYRDYAYLYELKNDYENAYKNMQKALVFKDTLYLEENNKLARELETKYQTEKKEQEIALLKTRNELTEQQKKSQRNLMLAGLGITTIAGLFLFVLYRNRQKTNTKLKALDTAKSNFFANISHEFRTPLTLISNPIEETLEDETISEVKREKFVMAKRNSERLLSLVNQLLDLSKIDAGQLKLQIQKSNPLQLIAALSESFHYAAKQQNIDYKVDVKDTGKEVWFDKDALDKITINLLSNAIKYTPNNGSVFCKAFIEDEKLFIEVKNSGIGLTKEQLSSVFKRFYKTSEENQGTGIGLALVKELVELHKGTIKVDSISNEFTTFTVILPTNKNSFKKEQFIDSEKVAYANELNSDNQVMDEDEEFIESDQPILLIVEDNDDVRTLLKQTFETTYNILTANNGDIGVALALEHIPDIIISDVMMPVKDGIALTNELKNDERTSHIPIILLTAKAGEENELKGIKTGADDYITKPFSSKILRTKVLKLIEIRKKLQSRYSQEVILMPKDIAITNIDEVFLEKVQTVLDNSLVEASFSIEDFSKAVGMSRMQLHRKIKALTGLSASDFIRSQRLKLAAQLLKKSDINVSQIGYTVGFNDHAYFSKCFKDMYQCTPTEYAKKQA